MNELSHEETIRFENSKAHLQKILGDVNDANSLLTKLISIKDDLEGTIVSLKEEVDSLSQEKNRLQLILVSTANDTQDRLDELDTREAEFAAIERNHYGKVLDLTRSVSAHEGRERTLSDNLKSHRNAVKFAKAELDELESSIESAEAELETVHSALTNIQGDLQETTNLIDDARDAFQKEHLLKLKELDRVNQQITDAQALVEAPFLALQAEREAHAKRQKDFNVIYNRMKRIYSEMFPGQTLTI